MTIATSVTAPTSGAANPAPMLGVLGGGQLGRMFVHAAQAQGYRVTVLEPDPSSPAAAAADRHLVAAYDDAAALADLARTCVAVTTEFENVPAHALQVLQASTTVAPTAAAVRVCQHRAHEKALFAKAGVPHATYALLQEAPHPDRANPAAWDPLLPGILKTAQLGYDGKGQRSVANAAELLDAWQALGQVPCVLERRLRLAHEISVVVGRGANGDCVHLPVQQNLHRDGILAVTQVPAPEVPPSTGEQAVAWATQLAQTLEYVGVLCVEFFVLQDGTLVANEMAPRPHNSGHYSIDACDLSQFDLQLRTLMRLPLIAPRQHSAAVMLNLLGDLWWRAAAPATTAAPAGPQQHAAQAHPQEPDWPAVLALPGTHLHLYGKTSPRKGRKMGHLTVTATTPAQAKAVALQACRALGLPVF
jgi:5-(carboxyamino)imidazole ribonucleotide synthase